MRFVKFFRRKKNEVHFVICSFFTIVSFQNCSQSSFQTRLPNSIDQEVKNQNDQLDLPSDVFSDEVDASSSSESIVAASTTALMATTTNYGKKIYYVATNGNDSNPGTISKPFRTIVRGSREIASGDTLYIRAGIYNEGMYHGLGNFSFRNGTPSAYTRYVAYPGEEKKVVIKNPKSSIASPHVVAFSDNSAYIELRGLVFDGINNVRGPGLKGIPFIPGYGIKGIRSGRIIGNVIRNSGMGLGGGRDSNIMGNEIYGMSDYGMYTGGGDNGMVEGNIFHDCGGYAIHHYASSATGKTINNWIFRKNIIYRTGRAYDHALTGDKLRKSPAVIIGSGSYNKFYNNIIYDSHGGISVAYRAVDSLIANNTVYGNDTTGISVSGSSGGSLRTRVINNIIYGNEGAPIVNTGTLTTFQNNLTTDPKFVSASSRNFRLQVGSPAIDKGVKLFEVPKDFSDIARPRGKAYDIGAFEF